MSGARSVASALMAASDGEPCEVPFGDGGQLFIGSVGASRNRESLLKAGITHVLCVAKDLEFKFGDEFVFENVSVLDQPSEDLRQHFKRTIAFIENALARNGRVLVHCFRGKSRSATILCAYLIFKTSCSVEEAMRLVRTNRPQAAPNMGFACQLNQFAREMKQR
mmetsp:Transcript_23989/g.42292  ORF Transcript_23989/g.42292 Transcript_23989/m.42292 type:complete len:165 (+) Transcript_23989:288-782(+)